MLTASPIVFRLLPFFPAVAVGNVETRIKDAIALTSGYTVRIWATFALTLVPAIALNLCFILVVTTAYDWQGIPLLPRLVVINLAIATSNTLVLALGVTANSEIFRRLGDFERPQMAESIPNI